jgi:stage II sporulation protein D
VLFESDPANAAITIGDTRFGSHEPLRMRAVEGWLQLGPEAGSTGKAAKQLPGYEGWVELTWFPPQQSGAEGRWFVVNRLPMERYLLGVIGNEVPATGPIEALRAQAIAARTYALFNVVTRSSSAYYHLSGDSSGQVYRGGLGAPAQVAKAVESTRNQVLMHNERLFCTYYHSTCGGTTRSAAAAFGSARIEPLSGVSCDNCAVKKDLYNWSAVYAVADVEQELRDFVERFERVAGKSVHFGELESIKPVERENNAYASYVRIEHTSGSFEVDAEEFRGLLLRIRAGAPLRSTYFDCKRDGGKLVFSGHGWGHGVGMCQNGALTLAKRDRYDCRAILSYYYPGAKLYEMTWQ